MDIMKECSRLLDEAREYAEIGDVDRMQHCCYAEIERIIASQVHNHSERDESGKRDNAKIAAMLMGEVMSKAYEPIARKGYTLAVENSLQRAEILMKAGRWSEADKEIGIAKDIYAPRAGIKADSLDKRIKLVYEMGQLAA